MAPIPTQPAASGSSAGGRGGGPELHTNDWNTAQLILDADVLALTVNRSPDGAGGTTLIG